MSTSEALKSIFTAARPLVETWLDTAEQIAALRETATNAGLDWSQVKALLKAQIQDERDEAGDGKRVRKLIEKAEFACAYADMLGLGNMNEGNISAPPHDPETGELIDPAEPVPSAGSNLAAGDVAPPAVISDQPVSGPDSSLAAATEAGEGASAKTASPATPDDELPDLPAFLDRRKRAAA